MSAFVSGSPVAGPDPFTVIPGLGEHGMGGGRGGAGRTKGEGGGPFGGLLARIAAPAPDARESGTVGTAVEDAVRGSQGGDSITEDLTALLLGTVTSRLRSGELPTATADEANAVAASGTPVDGAAETAALPVDPSKLHPELRVRLQRVIERMQAEYGHTVEIAEGYRTQDRQAQLYAQGRTQPGPVVTWTRDSLHTQGLAADVVIDGSYDNPAAYQRFAQLARQEGLTSLAPLDPGHVEFDAEALGLPNFGSTVEVRSVTADVARPGQVAQVAGVAEPARPAAISQVAAVARPAEVARPASVAPVARPAVPGETAGPQGAGGVQLASTGVPSASTRVPSASSGIEAASTGAEGEAGGSDVPSGRGLPTAAGSELALSSTGTNAIPDEPVRRAFEARFAEITEGTGGEGSRAGTLRADVDPRALAAPLTATDGALRAPEFPQVTTPVAGGEAMERAQRVRELLEASRRPVQQVTLAVDPGTGDEALMKVSLRDGRVAASIGVRDPYSAERLATESAALRAQLVRQGLEAGNVDVRTILPTLDADGGLSSRRDGQNPFVPGLGQPLDRQSGEEGGAHSRSRGYWETLNRERDRLFGGSGGNR